MIESFSDRRLKRLYENGEREKIPPNLLDRVEFILALLDASETLDGLNVHSLRLHRLIGDKK